MGFWPKKKCFYTITCSYATSVTYHIPLTQSFPQFYHIISLPVSYDLSNKYSSLKKLSKILWPNKQQSDSEGPSYMKFISIITFSRHKCYHAKLFGLFQTQNTVHLPCTDSALHKSCCYINFTALFPYESNNKATFYSHIQDCAPGVLPLCCHWLLCKWFLKATVWHSTAQSGHNPVCVNWNVMVYWCSIGGL